MLRTPVAKWVRLRLRQGYSPTEIVLELGRAVDSVVEGGPRQRAAGNASHLERAAERPSSVIATGSLQPDATAER
jgi:hypothetical protein